MQNFNEASKMVENTLNAANLDYKIVTMNESTRTANDAANAIGCELGQIVKSLVFKTLNAQPILILASGSNQVDEKIIESHLAQQIIKADANFVRSTTGFVIGGVAPIGYTNKIDLIIIDEDLLNYKTLWAAAGTPYSVFQIKPIDLIKLTHGKVIKIN